MTLLFPEASGVLALLARCGIDGPAGIVAMGLSCSLNITLGLLVLLRPTPAAYALQFVAVIGYTVAAAVNMPELTIDHCGPLVKNVPVLALVMLLWLAAQPRPRILRDALLPCPADVRAFQGSPTAPAR